MKPQTKNLLSIIGASAGITVLATVSILLIGKKAKFFNLSGVARDHTPRWYRRHNVPMYDTAKCVDSNVNHPPAGCTESGKIWRWTGIPSDCWECIYIDDIPGISFQGQENNPIMRVIYNGVHYEKRNKNVAFK